MKWWMRVGPEMDMGTNNNLPITVGLKPLSMSKSSLSPPPTASYLLTKQCQGRRRSLVGSVADETLTLGFEPFNRGVSGRIFLKEGAPIMVTIPNKERRQRPHVNRTFEKRFNGGEDVRVIRKFEDMGAKKVRTILSQVGFGNQNDTAKQWLESQGEGRSVWGLKLTLAIAIGCIGGVLLSFAL